jgi:hypothetical protein
MYNHHSSRLLDLFGQRLDWHRVDSSEVNEFDRRSSIGRTQFSRQEGYERRRGIAKQIDCAHWVSGRTACVDLLHVYNGVPYDTTVKSVPDLTVSIVPIGRV